MSLTARGVDLPIIDRTFLPSRFFPLKRMALSNLLPSGRPRKEVAMGTINRRVSIADGSRVSGAISCEIE
ncbi:hypothetical protein GE21DRAFT_1313458 [Neurospora crassa]|nr:hypothetical protein GE21DRAFT_1313458 [Neurospora crassa]